MLSEALRLIRVFHDVKQFDLARQLGVSSSYLSEIERGKKTPKMDLIQRYSERFDMPMSHILFFSENLNSGQETTAATSKARGVIAGKVIDFLRFVEERTDHEQT